MSIEIKRSDKYVDYNISAENNRGYITIDTSDWINKPWMFYELPALKFEIYTETNGELVKYQNFTREIRTYNPVYSPLGVLNVTIDIRNVPEEFILRITPIFDNDAIAARNMLIENGIENGDIWGSDRGVPTQLFNLDLEFIECSGEYIPPTPPVPPTHEETITGIPPITFDGSTGEPLVSWTILGNGQQTGTPSPDNIIMPTFCGVRTANLINVYANNTSNGYIDSAMLRDNGSIYRPSYGFVSEYQPINENVTYTMNTGGITGEAQSICFYTRDKQFISGVAYANRTIITFTAPQGAKYFRCTVMRTQSDTESYKRTMLNLGSAALPYEPFGWAEKITCAGQTTPVYLGQVSTVRKIRKLVFDGTEDWEFSAYPYIADKFITYGGNYLRQKINICICSHLQTSANVRSGDPVTPDTCCFNIDSIGGTFYYKDTSISSLSSFKSWLAQQYANGTPVTIWYVLAEPQTAIVNEPLAKIGDYADELSSTDAGVMIPTTKGQNTLTVNTDLQPSEVTITYTKEGQ